jgi:hypothetical protein
MHQLLFLDAPHLLFLLFPALLSTNRAACLHQSRQLTLLILMSVLRWSCSLPRAGMMAFLNLAARWSALLLGSPKSRGSVRNVSCAQQQQSQWLSLHCWRSWQVH